jgi:hypothetical protein
LEIKAMDSAARGPTQSPEQRADESVSARFTRLMNASTSPLGVLTDPPLVSLASGVFLLAFLAALGSDAGPVVVRVLLGVTLLPIVMALVVSLALLGARRRVIAWLARQPFPVENMNAVLNGLGEALEVSFAGELPAAAELNVELDKVHPDSFVTETSEDARTIDIRIGVVDSKRNPSVTNHNRYERVCALVDRVLVPLAERHPIASVRVK